MKRRSHRNDDEPEDFDGKQPEDEAGDTKKDILQYRHTLHTLDLIFRRNEVTGMVEMRRGRLNHSAPYEQLTQGLFDKILFDMAVRGCTSKHFVQVSISAEAQDNMYHPIKDYFARLPYDGGHYFDELCSCITNPDGLLPLYLRKWMVGAVAKVVNGAQNRMLVFDGPQLIGKSMFVEYLCKGLTAQYGSGYYVASQFDPESNDARQRLTRTWIWNIDELGSTMRKADREALKSILTQSDLTFRRPYAAFDETKPIITSFIATINNEGGFLDDPTGNRRFMVCNVTAFDYERYEKIDVNQLWGEIFCYYLMGESHELSKNEHLASESNNRKYEVDDPVELVLSDLFNFQPGNRNIWVSAADVLYAVKEKQIRFSTDKALQMAIWTLLKKHGIEKGDEKKRRVYYGLERKLILP